MMAKDIVAMLEDVDEAIRLNPTDAKSYVLRGKVSEALGRRDVAIVDYSRAITLDPKHAEGYLYRGLAYLGQGKEREGRRDLAECLKLQPDWKQTVDDLVTKVKPGK
jgi:tetratricopeptide (TPR) repeat protein